MFFYSWKLRPAIVDRMTNTPPSARMTPVRAMRGFQTRKTYLTGISLIQGSLSTVWVGIVGAVPIYVWTACIPPAESRKCRTMYTQT